MNNEEKPQVYVSSNENPQVVNNPFANMNMEKDELQSQKKKNKILIIVFSVIVTCLLLYIFIDFVGDAINEGKVEPTSKENLEEVSLDLIDFISENNLDALDAYGKDDLLMVAISHVCDGVYDCKNVSGDSVQDYLKTIFDKEIQLQDIQCYLSDGVLYSYDSNSDRFIYNDSHPAHEPLNTTALYTKVNSIKKKNEKYILVLNKLYYNPGKSEYISSDPFGINKVYNFSDYDMPSDNGAVIDMTKLISDYDNQFNRIKDKETRYEYTFRRDGKKYILEKYAVLETNNNDF